MIKPPALRPGDTIGIVAPAGPPDPEKLRQGLAGIEAKGFRVKAGRHLLDRRGYLAGTDADRAADLMEMFSDPEVRAIFSARGGYGSIRLLEHLDFELIARNPKILLGYSDITTLHLALRRRCGLVTFHGPMPAIDMARGLDTFSHTSFWDALTGAPIPRTLAFDPTQASPQALVRGKAEGELTGGCLCPVISSLGTLWEIETEGKILFLEDLHERRRQVDRMLIHLKLAGKLEKAAGFLIGSFPDPDPDSQESLLSFEEIYTDILLPCGKPTIFGYPIGHVPNPLTLPIGCRAALDADACALTLLESGVD